MRLVGDLVALHADVTHASGGHQVEDAVDHAKARTQDGHDGEFLAGKLFERGGSDGVSTSTSSIGRSRMAS